MKKHKQLFFDKYTYRNFPKALFIIFGYILVLSITNVFLSTMIFAAETQAVCESSGGEWSTKYEGSTLTTRCYCPANQTYGANGCFNSSRGSSGSTAEPVAFVTGAEEGEYWCGSGSNKVITSINFGCKGEQLEATGVQINPVVDMAFALFRFLSAGVGLVLIGSIIISGIQYASSKGNPQAVEASIKRVTNTVIGLILFIFMFALANYLVPGGMFI
jgi:hypothetical protein